MIIIIHGWGQSKEYWLEVEKKLAQLETTISIDLPGFGKRSLISSNWSIENYTNWLDSYIKENNFNNVILLGHSFGGRIVALLSTNSPSYLKGLILYAAPLIYRPSFFVKIRSFLAKNLKYFVPNKDKIKSILNNELTTADDQKLGSIFRKAVVFDITSKLKNIKVPTLILWGENDTTSSLKIGKEMKNLILNSNLEILHNVGHNAHLENSNLFYGKIKNFIEHL